MRRASLIAAGAALALLAGCADTTAPASGAPTARATGVACAPQHISWKYAGPVALSASLDGVTARLRATVERGGFDQWLTNPALHLQAAGQTWQTRPLPAPDSFRNRLRLVQFSAPSNVHSDLCLVRFAGTTRPVAVLATYAGGAHCCTTVRLYDAATRRAGRLDTGNFGVRVIAPAGRAVLRTADNRFAYAFADFADSGAPPQLVTLTSAGRLANVTRSFPAIIRSDAAREWRAASHRRIRLGFYAAWAADQELLGHDALVWRTMRTLNREGKLMLPKSVRTFGWPEGTAYISKLRRFLDRYGYR